ncbi:cNMP binding domain-containing protein [Legionella busanensis]|uniref:cNMP binding domain-containing protein n=1 Tax=Legionella busanensis TaxID=190655 RepID=A0A378JFW4_9GAMM|nr:cyclic nucleotide-binding domain-containing protein [Legionella busanensis]STX50075.1 cNMP binding domain-containing protein [Legionella busanensis]
MGTVSQINTIKFFFQNFTEKELIFLVNFISKESFEPGDLIISQGNISDSLYIIEKGSVDVYVTLPGDLIKSTSVLTAPQIFGEEAFLSNELMTTTIVAKTSVHCFLLKRSVLNALRLTHPEISFKIECAIIRQTNEKIINNGKKLINFLLSLQVKHNLRSNHADYLLNKEATYQDLNIKSINRQLLDKLAFLNALTKTQIDELVIIMRARLYEKGYLLDKQSSGKISLVFSGAVMFFLTNQTKLVKSIGIIGIGELFLQSLLAQNSKSLFKFVTCEESIILELDIQQYQKLKHLNQEVFYKVSQYIHTAFVRSLYMINRQFIRIDCEYMNSIS